MEPNTFSSHIIILKNIKVEKILKGSLDSIPHLCLLVKIQTMGGIVGGFQQTFCFQKSITQQSYAFIALSKLFRQ